LRRLLNQFVTILSPFLMSVTSVTTESIKYFEILSRRDFTEKLVTTVTGYKKYVLKSGDLVLDSILWSERKCAFVNCVPRV